MGTGFGDSASHFAEEALNQRFHEWETATDDGDIEFETSPDGFFGTRGCNKSVVRVNGAPQKKM